MHRIFRVKAYEKEHGPHFNEEYARKAVMKMENEDGTRGPHWSLEETTTLASQYGIALGSKFNRYDWFVALNMVYSDYYRVIMNITGSNNTKHYVEFAKAWLNDKDIDEGKMWYYYVYVMCDHIREAEMECYEEKMSKYEDEEEDFGHYRNSLLSDNTTKFNVLGSKIDAQTQIINDKFCQLEMREMQNKIDALRQENNQLALSASQQAQTANIVSQLKSPCPVPAYFVPNPNCCPFDYYRYLLNRDNTTTAPAA